MRKPGIGARLEEVRGSRTQLEMEAHYDIGANGWGRYEREERDVPTEVLLEMRRKDGINPDWLLTGEGQKYVHGTDEPAGAYSVADGFVRIPLYPDITASAGSGELLDPAAEASVEMRSFSMAWIRRELRVNPADLVLMHVEGDSMDNGRDGLKPGDVAIVNKLDTAATKDGVYVLRLGDALLVKRLQRLPGDRVKVISDNTAYPAFEVDSNATHDGFSIIGRVVYAWGGRRF